MTDFIKQDCGAKRNDNVIATELTTANAYFSSFYSPVKLGFVSSFFAYLKDDGSLVDYRVAIYEGGTDINQIINATLLWQSDLLTADIPAGEWTWVEVPVTSGEVKLVQDKFYWLVVQLDTDIRSHRCEGTDMGGLDPGVVYWLSSKGYLDNGFPATALAHDGTINTGNALKAYVTIEIPQADPYQFFDDFKDLPVGTLVDNPNDYDFAQGNEFVWEIRTGGLGPDKQHLSCERASPKLQGGAINWVKPYIVNTYNRDLEIVALLRLGAGNSASLFGPILMDGSDVTNYALRRSATDTFEIRQHGLTWATNSPVSNTFTYDETKLTDWTWIRIGNTGKEVHAKIWAYDTPEPDYWMATLDDGIRDYLRPALAAYAYEMEPFEFANWGFAYDAPAPMFASDIEKAEPLITFRKPWTRQPPPGTEIDWSNPITRGMRFITCPGTAPFDKVTNDKGFPDANAGGVTTGPNGLAYRTGGGASHGLDYSAQLPSVDAFSLLWLGKVVTMDDTYRASFCGQDATSDQIDWGFYSLSGGQVRQFNFFTRAGVALTSITALTEGESYNLVGTYRAGVTNGHKIYIDGKQDAQGTNTGSTEATGTMKLSWPFAGVINSPDVETAMMAVWDRALSAEEVTQLNKNPWQIFEPQTFIVPAGDAVKRRVVTF